MKTFEPSKKGFIKIYDKTYKLKTDSMTQTILASDSIPKLTDLRDQSEKLQTAHAKGNLSDEEYIDAAYELVDKLEEVSRRFCIRVLGRIAFEELEAVSGGLDFDDLNNIVTLVMLELTEIKNNENINMIKRLDHYE